jgi:hypothetical protein
MNIDKVLSELFPPQNVKVTPSSSLKDTSRIELTKLQTQMHQYATKEKKQYTPFFNFSDSTTYNVESMNTLIDQEIVRSQTKKSWKTMPKSRKWELVCAYFEKDGVKNQYDTQTIRKMKDELKKNIIAGKIDNIKYSAPQEEIVSIM